MARVKADEKLVEDFKAGKVKPQAKGKIRRTEIKADAELEGRMTDAQTKKPKARPGHEPDSKGVSLGSVKGVMNETFARVYEEIWPGMEVRDHHGEVALDVKEDAYILALTMLVGNDVDVPRKGLKMREIDGMGDNAPMCRECGAE